MISLEIVGKPLKRIGLGNGTHGRPIQRIGSGSQPERQVADCSRLDDRKRQYDAAALPVKSDAFGNQRVPVDANTVDDLIQVRSKIVAARIGEDAGLFRAEVGQFKPPAIAGPARAGPAGSWRAVRRVLNCVIDDAARPATAKTRQTQCIGIRICRDLRKRAA